MLPPHCRLPLGEKRTPVISFRSSYFAVKVFTTELTTPRFGFIVSKKTAAQAVTRNRLKRRLRAVIEQYVPQIKPGYDILFIIQREEETASAEELTHAVSDFLTKKALFV